MSGLSLRIALHAGPVYKFTDPVTGDRSSGGTHITARMEPITPPGTTLVKRSPLWPLLKDCGLSTLITPVKHLWRKAMELFRRCGIPRA